MAWVPEISCLLNDIAILPTWAWINLASSKEREKGRERERKEARVEIRAVKELKKQWGWEVWCVLFSAETEAVKKEELEPG